VSGELAGSKSRLARSGIRPDQLLDPTQLASATSKATTASVRDCSTRCDQPPVVTYSNCVASTAGADRTASAIPDDAVVAFDVADGSCVGQAIGRPDAGAGGAGFSSPPVLRTLATGTKSYWRDKSPASSTPDPITARDPVADENRHSGPGPAGGGVSGIASVVGPPGSRADLAALPGQRRDHAASTSPSRSAGAACEYLRKFDGAGYDDRCCPLAHRRSGAGLQLGRAQLARTHRRRRSPSCREARFRIDGRAFARLFHHRRQDPVDFDTAKDFPTKNGIKASGGPLDHGGATIVNGVVYVNSATPCSPSRSMGNRTRTTHMTSSKRIGLISFCLLLSFMRPSCPRRGPFGNGSRAGH